MAFTKPGNILPRMSGGKDKYTDTAEFLSPGVLIAFKKRQGYPSDNLKFHINRAGIQARNIVRIANDVLAKVVIQRRDEPAFFTQTMERHFNLKANGDLGGGLLKDNTVNKKFDIRAVFTHDRRWALEQIRRNMLSLSFHLNTGMYLIDQDLANRDVMGGTKQAATTVLGNSNEAYVYPWAKDKTFKLCGFRNGEIHAEFNDFPNYSLNSNARIIIHEAAHKFLDVGDTFYAWNVNYPPSLHQCLTDNADSYAWTAVSLATGVVRMDSATSSDWTRCPGSRL